MMKILGRGGKLFNNSERSRVILRKASRACKIWVWIQGLSLLNCFFLQLLFPVPHGDWLYGSSDSSTYGAANALFEMVT
jgi:hypothetical protein